MNLTWNDLIIQGVPPADAQAWLKLWETLVTGRFSPIFLSKFGDWFLRRPDGSTDELSVIEGRLSKVASTPGEFDALVNRVEWQEMHLLSWHVAQLHERGMVPARGECYGFVPHPILTGKFDLAAAVVMSLPAWQSIAAQSFFPANP